MLTPDDVESLAGFLDEKVMGVYDELLEVFEEFDLADEDGELADGRDAAETFEELPTRDQNKLEKALRKFVRDGQKAFTELAEELERIDQALLEDDDDGEDEEEGDDDQ